ncbi:MAG: hypothetical protein LBB58_05460 [Cellulomonadaceae bacterium]|jgi:hypothetical protein|nr:hypothetical protein [Cellulomonadaceae bacterium]
MTTLYILLAMLLPMLVTGAGVGLGVHQYRKWRQKTYLIAKREWSQRLLTADEQVCQIEAASIEDPYALKRAGQAREHLNNAFGFYSQNFTADHYRQAPPRSSALQLTTAMAEVDKNLAASTTAPGSFDRLKFVGADFGRDFAKVAVASGTKFLETSMESLNRYVNEPQSRDAFGYRGLGQNPNSGVVAQAITPAAEAAPEPVLTPEEAEFRARAEAVARRNAAA